jgi:hypothetical protein
MEEYFFIKTSKCSQPTWLVPCDIIFDLDTSNLVLDKISDNIKVDIFINNQYICSLSNDDFNKVNDNYVYKFKNWKYDQPFVNFFYLSIIANNCDCIPKLEYRYKPSTIADEAEKSYLRCCSHKDEIYYKDLIICLNNKAKVTIKTKKQKKGTARVLKQNN